MTSLLVPIHVDGLFLEKGRHGVQAMADFSRLPWVAGSGGAGDFEVNAESPFVSDTVNSEPLSDVDHWLKPGVHLHWALPTALATAAHPIHPTAVQDRDRVEFPCVPNRWLVCRWLGGIMHKSWLIESDYLWPPNSPLLHKDWIRAEVFEEAFHDDGPGIWQTLVDQGWVKKLFSTVSIAAEVVAKEERLSDSLGTWESKREAIEGVLKDHAHPDTRQMLTTYPYRLETPHGQPARYVEQVGSPPFRYLGRARNLGGPWLQGPGGNYLKDIGQPLTAVGYGEPNFAAFYPNCQSVFGHYDPTSMDAQSLWYEVFGWYADVEDDPLHDFVTSFHPDGKSIDQFVARFERGFGRKLRFQLTTAGLRSLRQPTAIPDSLYEKLNRISEQAYVGKAAFAEAVGHAGAHWDRILEAALPQSPAKLFDAQFNGRFGWTWPDARKPDRILCYGRVHRPSFIPPADKTAADLQLAVANTGTEAVSAFVASRLAADRYPHNEQARKQEKGRVERFLEALDLVDKLGGEKLDVGAKLESERHAKTFTAHPGSRVWVIHPRQERGGGREAESEGMTLPEEIGHALNALNGAQQAYDRARDRVAALRWQLYSDWYRYMHNAYPENVADRDHKASRSSYHADQDVDLMIDFIKRRSLRELHESLWAAGEVLSHSPGDLRARHFVGMPASRLAVAGPTVRLAELDLRFDGQTWQAVDSTGAAAEAQLAEPFRESPPARQPSAGPTWRLAPLDVPPMLLSLMDTDWGLAGSEAKISLSKAQAFLHALDWALKVVETHHNNPPRVVYKDTHAQGLAKAGVDAALLQRLAQLKDKPYERQPGTRLIDTFSAAVQNAIGGPIDPALFQLIWGQVAPVWVLETVPGPRYWEPNDPVLLIAGRSAQPSERWETRGTRFHNEDGRLVCKAFDAAPLKEISTGAVESAADVQVRNALSAGPTRQSLDAVAAELGLDTVIDGRPQPFLLEWQVEVAPVRHKSNMPTASRRYDPAFFQKNWSLGENYFNLRERPGMTTLTNSISSYRGRSVLGAYAPALLAERLATYVVRRLAEHVVPVLAKPLREINLPPALRAEFSAALASKAVGHVLSPRQASRLPETAQEMRSWFDLYAPGEKPHADTLSGRYAEIHDWIVHQRLQRDLFAAGNAYDQMKSVVLPGDLRNSKRQYGLPDGDESDVAELIKNLVNSHLGAVSTSEDQHIAEKFFKEQVGLAPEVVAPLIEAAKQGTSITSLKELDDCVNNAGPEPFVQLLRYADAHASITAGSDPQLVLAHGLVYGLPDGGTVARGILAVANELPAEQLQGEVGLSPAAVAAVVDVRAIQPFASLAQLDSLEQITVQSIARLLIYADVKGKMSADDVPAAVETPAASPAENSPRDTTPEFFEHTWEDFYGHHWVDPLLSAFDAWHHLQEYPNLLTQSLGGFNDALSMRRRCFQLPVADPLGFEDYRTFSEHVVRPAVGDETRRSPQPISDFHPIRSGDMGLTAVRLVDLFGQYQDVNSTDVTPTEQMATDRSLQVALTPRFTQPARLQFRWLAAEHHESDEMEWNTHPATTPICGWVVANNLDASLVIYDNQGQQLGSIDRLGRWRTAPGGGEPRQPHEIDNPHLRQMVEYLVQKGQARADQSGSGAQTFIEIFTGLIETALEHIHPESSAQPNAQVLLMSRPVALVRASVGLELRDPPAVQQSNIAFSHELQRKVGQSDFENSRETDGFEYVRVPVRIGEHLRFQDGVIGYWKEGDGGQYGEDFFAPQSAFIGDATWRVYRQHDGAFDLSVSFAQPPQTVSVLMDPHGSLHATCGLLPAKRLTVPPDQYVKALERIRVSFLTAPLLTDRDRLRVSLPGEPGWSWTWLAHGGIVQRDRLLQLVPQTAGGHALWDQLIRRGALIPVQDGGGKSIDGQARLDPGKLQDGVDGLEEEPLRQLLERVQWLQIAEQEIERPYTEARFHPQELREGWLTLSRAEAQDSGEHPK